MLAGKRAHSAALAMTFVICVSGCGVSTAPIDPAIASIAGRYTLTASVLKPEYEGSFNPGGVARNVISDVYTLNDASGWTRDYKGTETDASGTRTVEQISSGTYQRSGATLAFIINATVVARAQFTGTQLVVDATDRTLTYTRAP